MIFLQPPHAALSAASRVVILLASVLYVDLPRQHRVPATPAQPRVGGITGLSHSSELEGGMRMLGSVHVGPPVRLLEAVPPHAEGADVVPVAYAFQFLHGSQWRVSSDGLFLRPAAGRELVGFRTWVRGSDEESRSDRTQVDVSILPRDELTWTAVQTGQDIRVTVNEAREE